MTELDKIREKVLRQYNPEINGQGYWENGNYDDAFQMGIDVGYNRALADIGFMLDMDLPNEKEVEF